MNTSMNSVDADNSLKLDVRAAILMLPLLWLLVWFHSKVIQFKYKMIQDFSLLVVNMCTLPRQFRQNQSGPIILLDAFSVQAQVTDRVRK